MDIALVAKGHGYETGSQGRCTAFDGFTILANPLGDFSTAGRGLRVWQKGDYAVTYGSHTVSLAVRTENPRGLYILGHHGGGREVWSIPTGPDWKGMRDALLAMEERALYSFLYSIWQLASNAHRQAVSDTAQKWAQAYADGHLKKKRAGRGRASRVEIRTPTTWESGVAVA